MSTVPDLDLDLETLFQPAWTQAKTESNRFEKYTGNEGVKPERRFSDKPGERRGPRRDGPGGGGGGERRGGGGDRGPRSGGSRFGGKGHSDRRDDRRDDRREPAPALAPLPDLNVAFLPDDKGVEQLARQIKITGRAYPLFQIAQLVLQKPERYAVQLTVKKKADGTVAQGLFVCALDDSPWLSEDEAVAHVLKNHFATFYQAERTATEAPKGTYTFVAQCGMSGVILGPPNYHDYQNQLRKLHAEKFSRMPFEVFKSRVKIVKDEAVVKKWIEEQSFKTEYNCLNVAEPLKLASMEEVEKHFRATHKDSIIKAVESHIVAGVPSRSLRSSGLQRLVRKEWEDQKYFPLPVATKLSQQFASHGLQFFKVNKTFTHVAVARPQYLDLETTPVSENIRRIVEYINANAKCTRKKLMEALAPAPAVIEIKPECGAVTPAEAGPTPEQTAVVSDLHWLIHQGHVLEFADGRLETAKKPAPRPPKAEKKPAADKAEKPATEAAAVAETPAGAATETAPVVESSAAPVAEVVAPIEPLPAMEPAPVPAAAVESLPASSPEAPNQIASGPPVS